MVTLLQAVRWNADGLVPAIAQDAESGKVLMLAWMNEDSLRLTLETAQVHYWSRSRNELWRKGARSGHTQALASLLLDCDGDTLLLKVHQTGAACHTGKPTCFFQEWDGKQLATND